VAGRAADAELHEALAARSIHLVGGRDPLVNAQFLDEQLPNSRLASVHAGHLVWDEAPAE
jgi:hypothetical protein